MSLSSLPTGTISRGGAGSRTHPPDEAETGRSTAESTSSTRPVDSSDDREVASLRRENEALRRANARLKKQLDASHEDRHEVIDHYERLLEDRYRQHARRTASDEESQTHAPPGRRPAIRRVRPVVVRVAERVLSSLGLR